MAVQAVDGTGDALLELHLALGNDELACGVALAGAEREQAAGQYKVRCDVGILWFWGGGAA